MNEPHLRPRDNAAFDRSAALTLLGGDKAFLVEVAGLFLEDAPRMIGEVRRGVADGDAGALRRAAHGLKGSVGYLEAGATSAAAARLEKMGASGDLNGAVESLRQLEWEMERLADALSTEVLGVPRNERAKACQP
jgi:HPt (histidine-containing phosphotransfer) domain-containing protein